MSQLRSTGRASVPSGPGSGRNSAARTGFGSTGRARVSQAADPWDDVAPLGDHGGPGGRGPGGGGPGGGGHGWGGGDDRPVRSGRRRPRWGRIAAVLAGTLAVVLVATGIGVYLWAKSLDDHLKRTDAFAGLTNRPGTSVSGAQNILMLGSDSRNPDNINYNARTDTIMLLHVTAAHDKAYLISIPRDLYVYIPKSRTSQYGDTHEKINAAFAWGGTPLMVQTVETYTGVHIDHVALIDFSGLRAVTDALGGVDMYVEQDVTSIHTPRHWTKGWHHFSGDAALDYIRQRKQFAEGDFARVRHQQAFLKAMLNKAASTGTLTNPLKLKAFLESFTKAMVVDKDFSLVDSAIAFRNLRSSDITFMTSPNLGSDTRNGESVVVSDKATAASLYDAVRQDRVADWLKQHPQKK